MGGTGQGAPEAAASLLQEAQRDGVQSGRSVEEGGQSGSEQRYRQQVRFGLFIQYTNVEAHKRMFNILSFSFGFSKRMLSR